MLQHLLILDFETNCIGERSSAPTEIVEVPITVLDVNKNQIVDMFHSYVRPTTNPILTDYCKKVTHLSQKTINEAPIFEYVVFLIEKLIRKYPNSVFITDGNWDLKYQLSNQIKNNNVNISESLEDKIKNFKNLKHEYVCKYAPQLFAGKLLSLKEMMRRISMHFTGNLHSGLDNVRNITCIVQRMITDGHKF